MHLLSLALPMLLLGVAIGQSDDPSHLGCFSDPDDNRVFEFESSDPAMSAEVCSDLCSGSAFYGTQYSTECWCGDNAEYDDNGVGVCDMSCSGDSSEFCGGSYSMNVYENPDVDEPIYLGCYSDPPADNRLFELLAASSEDMTAEVCLGHCVSYEFYGTQYSTECWCGNNSDYDANGVGECDMSCSGDPAEVCGGSYSMDVYENPDADYVRSYRGCYSDPADNRVFVQSDSSDAMTAELCASQCTGSAFYGTQYSTECWCGDINAQYSVNGEGVCDIPCSGNSDETCGGSYSMSVYAQDPAYVGCFQDSSDRIFEWFHVRSTSNDKETCKSACDEFAAYYGTQHSEECWCGRFATYDDIGFGVCDMPCAGTPDEVCGGEYTMSVYHTIN